MNRRIFPCLSLILCLTPAAFAQDFLPAPEIADLALSSHPDVLAEQERANVSRGEARRLAADPYEWTLSGTYLNRSIRGVGDFSEYDAGIARGLRLPGKADIDHEIGRHGVSAAENAAEDARHQAALRLLGAWLGWLSARETAAIHREQVAAFEREVGAVERRLAINDAAAIDVEMARAALAESQAAAARSAGAVLRTVASLMAWFPELPLPASPILISPPALPDDLDTLRQAVISNSHEIGYVEDIARRADAVAQRAKADETPDPQVGLRVFSERDGDETGLGVTFSVPIGGEARSAMTYERYAAAEAARRDVQRVRRTVLDTAETDAIRARSEHAAWLSAQRAAEDSTRVVQRLRDGYGIGASSLADLLMAERRHLDSRLMEAEARTQATFAILKLKIDAHEMWID
ncbi:MAG: TolC family protein [Hyphomonadaceae bacterium]